MLLELNKSEYNWFNKFLENFYMLSKSHVMCGMKITDNTRINMIEILKTKPEKSGLYLLPMEYEDMNIYLELVENNMACCPGCQLSNVKHRKSVEVKLLKLIDEVESY